MKESSFKISTRNRWRRNWLRALGFTYPLWGGLAALFFIIWCGNGSPPDFGPVGVAWTFLSPFLLLGGHLGLALLCFDSLEQKDGLLIFPGPLMRRHKISSLKRLELKNQDLIFHFEDGRKARAKADRISISLDRINGRDRLRLLDFILDNAPNCAIEESQRKILENSEALPVFESGKALRIPYDSDNKRKAFFEICRSYEKFFWFIWGGICTLAEVFLAPVVAYAIAYVPHRMLHPGEIFVAPFPIEEWAKLWFTPLGKIVEPSANLLGKFGNFLNDNPAASVLLLLIAVYFFYQALKLIGKPDEIVLEKSSFRLNSKHFGWLLYPDFFWKDCKKLTLAKLGDKVTESKVKLCGDAGPLLEFELRGITKPSDKHLIARAIEEWAPHVEIDAEFLELVQSGGRLSYTELWLQSLNTPPKRDRLSPLKPGESLQNGEYHILETIGAGGQGIAYLAERIDRASGRLELVVVKEFVLPVYVDRRARQHALERFEKESETLRTLKHPNIVELKNHFIEDHRAYLVLERINGKSLRKLAEQKGFRDDAFVANLLEQMCNILIYLQEQEPALVHRDFTPDNLILDESGVLKLIDFNLARQDSSKSRIGVVGKHAYMPPEQFAGRPTIQSDIYALGASLYFCLAGRDPEPFSQSCMPLECSSMDPLWAEIISACTELDLNKRMKSARELLLFLNNRKDIPGAQTVEIPKEEIEVLNG